MTYQSGVRNETRHDALGKIINYVQEMYSYHANGGYSPRTAHPGVLYPPPFFFYTTATCQIILLSKHLKTWNICKPSNHIKQPFTSQLLFLLCHEVNYSKKKKVARHVTKHPENFPTSEKLK